MIPHNADAPRPMLIMRASGGLSNRLQAVAAGVGYCLLTGRALLVDWRDGMYSDDFSNVFPRWFTVHGLPTACLPDAEALLRDDARNLHPPFWSQWLSDAVAVEYLFDNDHLHPENVARTSLDFLRLDYNQPVLAGWGWDLTPALKLAPLLRQRFARFADDADMDIVRRLLTEHIIPAPDIRAEADAFAARRFTPGRTVGIHIRHTDLQSPLDRMLRTLRDVTRPDDTIFLATDNRHVEKMVRRLFPAVLATEKTFPPHDAPLHSHVPGLSNVRKGREALLDMLLLARCDRLVHYGPSSFARIPALLSGLGASYIHQVY